MPTCVHEFFLSQPLLFLYIKPTSCQEEKCRMDKTLTDRYYKELRERRTRIERKKILFPPFFLLLLTRFLLYHPPASCHRDSRGLPSQTPEYSTLTETQTLSLSFSHSISLSFSRSISLLSFYSSLSLSKDIYTCNVQIEEHHRDMRIRREAWEVQTCVEIFAYEDGRCVKRRRKLLLLLLLLLAFFFSLASLELQECYYQQHSESAANPLASPGTLLRIAATGTPTSTTTPTTIPTPTSTSTNQRRLGTYLCGRSSVDHLGWRREWVSRKRQEGDQHQSDPSLYIHRNIHTRNRIPHTNASALSLLFLSSFI